MSTSQYEAKRDRARQARREAEQLRELQRIATCGLDMKYRYQHDHRQDQAVNYGTYTVPNHIALRIADQYLVWAAEYDAIAEAIEAEMNDMFAARSEGEDQHG